MAIETGIFGHTSSFEDRFIPNYDKLKDTIERCRGMGLRIVLTQGVFDLVHEGHAQYLEKAKELGDILIVGVDSDELTKERKGPERPVVPEEERLKMLTHLRHVDIVTLREVEHGLGGLIRLIKPDVLVVSKTTDDFTEELVAEYENDCGEIASLPPQATTSTTARIRLLTIQGAHKLSREINELTKKYLEEISNN